MKPIVSLAGIALSLIALAQPAVALANPPDPPPPPSCKTCDGPPAPPTPGPKVVPSQQVVDVQLSPTHVSRGQVARIEVVAQQDVAVTISVRYRGDKKPTVSHARVGESGDLLKKWRVPKDAPLGTGQVRVDITGEDSPFTSVLIVTK